MTHAAVALFGRGCLFGLLASAGFCWMWSSSILAGDLARARHAWAAASLLVLSAIGLGLTALAFWPPDPVPLPKVLWRVFTPA